MMANEDDYEKAFNILDSNGDGFIDEEDLIRVLENYGENADKVKNNNDKNKNKNKNNKYIISYIRLD